MERNEAGCGAGGAIHVCATARPIREAGRTTAKDDHHAAPSLTQKRDRGVCPAILRAALTTLRHVTDDRSAQDTTLGDLGALARSAAEASRSEREALEERESAVVAAVRAGARLDEIAQAAGVTKAAASAIVRKTLAARSGRGGPYRRRRGVEVALREVEKAAARTTAATRSRRFAIAERDGAILAAADEGIAIRSIAAALGMDIKVAYTLIRRRRKEATQETSGTLASPIANDESADTIA